MTSALQWLGYCVIISLALALGAHAYEDSARAAGRQGRWGWVVALFASVLLPIISVFRPLPGSTMQLPLLMTISQATAGSAHVADPVSIVSLPTPVMLWATLSFAVVAFLFFSYMRLMRASRSWKLTAVNGLPVYVSHDVGPAALGVVRSDIVLPEWVLSLETRARELMLLHESEHLRMWDPRLMLASLLVGATMPWNPLIWLMVHRLRIAIELDCDARVLARDPDPVRYGAVLIEVGRRRSRSGFALATFAEPRSQLERRIRRMAQWPGRKDGMRATLLAVCALLLGSAAYAAQAPTSGRMSLREFLKIPATPQAAPVASEPVAVEGTDTGLGGKERDTIFVELMRSLPTSVTQALDAPAVVTLDAPPPPMPVLRADTPMHVGDVPMPQITAPHQPQQDISAAPVFTPMTLMPRLLNQAEIEASVARVYPPLLRDGGIGGNTKVWFFIDETGRVVKWQINKSSGYEALDMAALKVAPILRFAPAQNRDVKVPVWVAIDIVFKTR